MLEAELLTLNSNFTSITCFSFMLAVLEVVVVDTLVLVGGSWSRAMASSGGPSEDEVIVHRRFIVFLAVGRVRFS